MQVPLPLVAASALVVAVFFADPASSSNSYAGRVASEHAGNPVELGRVSWLRDLDQALATSERTGKPVFALFQEIPGCVTCQRFGSGPLSHPLLVEAIEECFVPLAIYNNQAGRDAEVLARFREPAWNNPVVRFLDAQGDDFLRRADSVWGTGAVAARMVAALEAAERPVPRFLRLVVAELAPEEPSHATFAMACFWQGEARLGALDGVLATRAGWLDGHEVVDVTYDARRLDFGQLLAAARRSDCAREVFVARRPELEAARKAGLSARRLDEPARDARSSDQHYYLRHSPVRFLPLTDLQRVKLNASLGRRGSAAVETWLSPRQLRLLERVREVVASDPAALRPFDPSPAPAGPGGESGSVEALADRQRRLVAMLDAH